MLMLYRYMHHMNMRITLLIKQLFTTMSTFYMHTNKMYNYTQEFQWHKNFRENKWYHEYNHTHLKGNSKLFSP